MREVRAGHPATDDDRWPPAVVLHVPGGAWALMPIRASEKARYPKDWPEISLSIRRDRAKWYCECNGECGKTHVGGSCGQRQGWPIHWPDGSSRVVLTVAHLNHTPEDVAPANLRAMCQGCHLRYDARHHAETARATRAARVAAAGQLELGV